MQLIFLVLARDELVEAKRFYNRQQQGLGESFQRETSARISWRQFFSKYGVASKHLAEYLSRLSLLQ